MKRLLVAAAALSALAGAAVAQPAYDASQGPAPSEYPKCTKPGQDRCVAGGQHRMRHKARKAPKAAPKGGASTSRDGERG